MQWIHRRIVALRKGDGGIGAGSCSRMLMVREWTGCEGSNGETNDVDRSSDKAGARGDVEGAKHHYGPSNHSTSPLVASRHTLLQRLVHR